MNVEGKNNLAELTPAGSWKVWVFYEGQFTCMAITSTRALAEELKRVIPQSWEHWQPVITRALVTDMQVENDEEQEGE